MPIQQFVLSWGEYAPWIIFALILLAGFNVPISIDILLALASVLAAELFPEKVYLFFFTFTFGCIFSAWIAYSLGRFLSHLVPKIPLVRGMLSPKRIEKISLFYKKWGLWTFFIGRFIPFGIRNVIFLSSGMSKVSFIKFALVDSFACFLWSSIFFTSFYTLGKNLDTIQHHLKWINISLFTFFSVAVIALICYKLKKRTT